MRRLGVICKIILKTCLKFLLHPLQSGNSRRQKVFGRGFSNCKSPKSKMLKLLTLQTLLWAPESPQHWLKVKICPVSLSLVHCHTNELQSHLYDVRRMKYNSYKWLIILFLFFFSSFSSWQTNCLQNQEMTVLQAIFFKEMLLNASTPFACWQLWQWDNTWIMQELSHFLENCQCWYCSDPMRDAWDTAISICEAIIPMLVLI